MGETELPSRAQPEALYEVCSVLGDAEEKRSKLYDKVDYGRRQVSAATDMGEMLGFLEYVDSEPQSPVLRMDDLGWPLHYADDIDESGVKNSFQKAIRQFEPYRNALLAIYEEDGIDETEEGKVIKRDTVKEKMNKYCVGEVDNRPVNVFLRTAQFAGLGERKVGRRGYQTRLILSPDFDSAVENIVSTYDLPAPVEGSESVDSTDTEDSEGSQVTLEDETVNGGAIGTDSGGDKELGDATQGIIAELRNDDVTIQIDIDISGKSDEEVLQIINDIRGIAQSPA